MHLALLMFFCFFLFDDNKTLFAKVNWPIIYVSNMICHVVTGIRKSIKTTTTKNLSDG